MLDIPLWKRVLILGVIALGFVAVLVFIWVSYGLFRLFADIALLLNIVFL